MNTKLGRTSIVIWIVFLWLVVYFEVFALLPHLDGIGNYVFAFVVYVPLFLLVKRLENRWRDLDGRSANDGGMYKPTRLSPSRVLMATLVVAAWIAFVLTGMIWSTRFNIGWLQFVWIGVLLTTLSCLEIKWRKQDARGTDRDGVGAKHPTSD